MGRLPRQPLTLWPLVCVGGLLAVAAMAGAIVAALRQSVAGIVLCMVLAVLFGGITISLLIAAEADDLERWR